LSNQPYSPQKTIQSFPPAGSDGNDIEPGFLRFLPLPTAQTVKENYMFGVPLTSPVTKQTLSDNVIEKAIVKAISEIEHELKLFISPVTIKQERHNYSWTDFYHSFAWIQLNHRPILEIQKMEVSIPSAFDAENLVEWPTAWIKTYREYGTLQLVPLAGSGSVLITQISSGVSFPIRMFNADNFPQFWAVTYRVGFENDMIPAMIVDLIEVTAAIKMLSLLGPVLFPYNSYSLNADGLGQSVSTPGPQWLASRVRDLTEQRQALMDAARSYYELKWSIGVLGG
jgi:hypothetical protein